MSDQAKRQRLSQLLIEFVATRETPLSGRQLARLLDVNAASAAAYLDGVTYPSEENRHKIAKVLGLSFEELQAKIDGVTLPQKRSTEETCQEIRLMSNADFAQVMSVMAEEVSRRFEARIHSRS